MTKIVIGVFETNDFSDLSLFDLQVRIDTGVKTSSLHVDKIVK